MSTMMRITTRVPTPMYISTPLMSCSETEAARAS